MSTDDANGHCKRIVIFDFDHTLIDCNSDEHVFPMLTKGKAVPITYTGGSWLGHMGLIFEHLHKEHLVSPEEFTQSLETLPFVSGIPELIVNLSKQPGHQLMVLSDANEIFIEHALKANNLRHLFSKIYTNKAAFDQFGCLKVEAHEDQAMRAAAGTCPTGECPENLCKGSEIVRIIDEFKQYGEPEIWYCGDGWNDWCASVQLPSEKHHVFARKGYTLYNIINRGGKKSSKKKLDEAHDPTLKCNASFWKDGHELAECMYNLDPSIKP